MSYELFKVLRVPGNMVFAEFDMNGDPGEEGAA
jgi:hypothetical protein